MLSRTGCDSRVCNTPKLDGNAFSRLVVPCYDAVAAPAGVVMWAQKSSRAPALYDFVVFLFCVTRRILK